jgi:hypothetical protein
VANQALYQRRLQIKHVNSSVKRCRIVKDGIRLWKQGVRDLVMELCCALHNFRGTPHALATNDLIEINSMDQQLSVADTCQTLRISQATFYRYVTLGRCAAEGLG